jgi:hypothetical protein
VQILLTSSNPSVAVPLANVFSFVDCADVTSVSVLSQGIGTATITASVIQNR